ncbi:MAG: hypothetical protein QM698_14215 [Micropepsaceae bacterium]
MTNRLEFQHALDRGLDDLTSIHGEERRLAARKATAMAIIQTAREGLSGRSAEQELIRAIFETVGDRAFTSGELIRYVDALGEAAGVLKPALDFAPCGRSARRLGKLLDRVKGRDFGGLSVHRVGAERDGAVWTVSRE